MLSSFLAWLEKPYHQHWEIVHHEVLPGKPPRMEPIPAAVDSRVRDMVRESGVESLYAHQAETIEHCLAGRSVALSTSTASGKTLAFQIPVLDSMVRDPNARALLIFPLKALERDQRDSFANLAAEAGISISVYDGDTPEAERRLIRRTPPRILITNPDMLHLGFLAYHHAWKEVFANLRYVVLDEVHTYKGIFGSNISQVLLRLKRVCAEYGAQPRFIACSATIANPGTFVGTLLGEPVSVVDVSGAPSPKRHFLFLNPVLSPYTVAARLFVNALERGLKTIVFTRARKITELITTWVLQDAPHLRDRISSYRAGFLPEERREIEAALFSGAMDGVISTSALEMGIDVGGLDLCLLIGYPGTIVNTWQRGGRVGRGGRSSGIVLIAGQDALDQYFLNNPDDFFSRSCEEAVLDPYNREVLKRHIPCAAAEVPLHEDEAWAIHPEVRSVIEELVESGRLAAGRDGSLHSASRNPQQGVDLRGIGESFSIISEVNNRVVGNSSGTRALRECHEGAVYLHRTKQYVVTKLDLERRNVFVRPERVAYYTRAVSEKDTRILSAPIRRREFPGFAVSEAKLEVIEHISAYEKRRTSGQELIGLVDLDLPPIHFETVGIWIEIPEAVAEAIHEEGLHFMGGIHAMEHAAISMFPLFALCDRDDIGGISTPRHEQVCRPAVFIYDGHPGGVGLAHRAFDIVDELLRKTLALVETCPCDSGCPSCIHSPKCGSGNKPLDKVACKRVLQWLLDPVATAARIKELQQRKGALAKQAPASLPASGTVAATLLNGTAPGRERLLLPEAGGLTDEMSSETPESLRDVKKPPKVVRRKKAVIFPELAASASQYRNDGPTLVGGGRKPSGVALVHPPGLPREVPPSSSPAPRRKSTPVPREREQAPAFRRHRIVVFDLETQKLADEVGGWKNARLMRVSLGVTWSDSDGFRTFTEEEMQELVALLRSADLVVGFNQMRFDYEVLTAYTSYDLRALPNLDILVEVQAAVGHRLSLDHLAHWTLGDKKSGSGLDAAGWFRDGKFDLLEAYCQDDVRITRDLYRFGLDHGHLRYQRRDRSLGTIPVSWGEPKDTDHAPVRNGYHP